MTLYTVHDGEYDWTIAAETKDEAIRRLREQHEIGIDPADPPLEVTKVYMWSDLFTLGYPDGVEGPFPEVCTIDYEKNQVTATVIHWIAILAAGDLVGTTFE